MLRMMLRTTLLALVAAGCFLFSRPSDVHAYKPSFAHLHAFSLPLGGTFHKLQQKGAFFQTPASVATALSATSVSTYGTLVQPQTDFGAFAALAIALAVVYIAVYLTSLGGNIWAAVVPHRAGRLAWGIVGIVVSTFFLTVGFITLSFTGLTSLIYILPSTALLGLSISNVVLGARMPRPLSVSLLPFVAPDPQGRPISGLLFSGSF